MAAPKKGSSPAIEQQQFLQLAFEVGGSAMIQNAFNQKTIEEMLRKHMGLTTVREKKVPADCIERATIRNVDDKVCIPPTAFKKAMLSAAGSVKGLKKTQLRCSLFVQGNSIPITFSRMTPRMDMVRTSGMKSTPDVRFRPCFEDWKARLIIVFPTSVPSQTVVDLLNRAGNVGIGEWRPEKDGTFGTFEILRVIDDTKEINEVKKSCRPAVKPLTIPEWAMNAELTPEILHRVSASNATEEADADDE